MEKANINLKFSNKDLQSGETEKYDMVLDGLISEKAGKTYILYNDSKILDIEETKTTIILNDKEISIQRKGAINSKLRFKQGEIITCNYRTASVDFLVETDTKKYAVNKSNDSIIIELDYYLCLEGTRISNTSFYCEVEMEKV